MRSFLFFFTILFSMASAGQRQPPKSFKDCPDCPDMVVIPAGSFLMGSPASEDGHDSSEGPQRKVTIKKFALGKFHITRGQWERFVKATKRPIEGGCAWSGLPGGKPWDLNPAASWKQLSFPQEDSHPAVCLSWKDAQDYLQWISKRTGFTYRLPSEAEWEYAARAGSVTSFPWGDKIDHEHTNYGADSGWTGLASGRDKWVATSPAGSFAPNAFGLYDMPGNVMQYMADCYSSTYDRLPTDGSPFQKDSCASRMVRGGDWGDPPTMLRSAFRNWVPGPGATLENYRSAGLGLRVVREYPDGK